MRHSFATKEISIPNFIKSSLDKLTNSSVKNILFPFPKLTLDLILYFKFTSI